MLRLAGIMLGGCDWSKEYYLSHVQLRSSALNVSLLFVVNIEFEYTWISVRTYHVIPDTMGTVLSRDSTARSRDPPHEIALLVRHTAVRARR